MNSVKIGVIQWSQRLAIAAVALLAIWIIVAVVFVPLNERLPLFFALTLTYFISAYIILPPIVHVGLVITRRGRVPRSTRAGDGLPDGPVNLLLIGSEHDLLNAFKEAGWYKADRLTLRTSWRMFTAFVRNKPYPTAPFRALYLFARMQDHGFQIPIGTSPRVRHHVRFWGVNYDAEILDSTDMVSQVQYWTKKQAIDPTKPMMWVGSGTKDLGIGLTRLTYQITHRVDTKNVDEEREYIFESLSATKKIADKHYVESGAFVVGKYRSDGRILTATLATVEG